MAGQVRAAVYAAVRAVRRRQVRLEGLDRRARRRAGLACGAATVTHPVTHECLLPNNTHPSDGLLRAEHAPYVDIEIATLRCWS